MAPSQQLARMVDSDSASAGSSSSGRFTAIDLALSGGGFRATLFHLGLIAYLRRAHLLRKVRIICSVSGGSIAAAHLVAHWKEYCGTEDQLESASAN
jgi:predicted acylesterase/phospholipase RssA